MNNIKGVFNYSCNLFAIPFGFCYIEINMMNKNIVKMVRKKHAFTQKIYFYNNYELMCQTYKPGGSALSATILTFSHMYLNQFNSDHL